MSPTIRRMVTHHYWDGHSQSHGWLAPSQGCSPTIAVWHLDLTPKVKTRWQMPWLVTHLPKDDHPPSKRCSPALSWMVTYHPQNGHKSSKIWSPTFPRIVTKLPTGKSLQSAWQFQDFQGLSSGVQALAGGAHRICQLEEIGFADWIGHFSPLITYAFRGFTKIKDWYQQITVLKSGTSSL